MMGRLDRAGVPGRLSELDEYAAEQALRVQEGGGGCGSFDACICRSGPAGAAEALRKALWMGGDAAVHVSDEGLQMGRMRLRVAGAGGGGGADRV